MPGVRAREGPVDELGLPGDELSGRKRQPEEPEQVVVTFGSYINKDSNETNGCAPAGFNPARGSRPLHRRQAPGRATTTSWSASRTTAVRLHRRRRPTRGRADVEPGPGPGDDRPVLAVGGVQQETASSRSTTTTASTASTTGSTGVPSDEDRLLRHHAVGSRDLTEWGTTRVTSSSMPPPTQFGGAVLRRLHRDGRVGNKAVPIWADTRDPELFLCPGGGRAGRSAPARTRTPTGDVSPTTRTATRRSDPIPRSERTRGGGRYRAAPALGYGRRSRVTTGARTVGPGGGQRTVAEREADVADPACEQRYRTARAAIRSGSCRGCHANSGASSGRRT